MQYVSIDIETTGLNPDTCQVLEIAAIADDLTKPFNEQQAVANCFHAILLHDQIKGSAEALRINADLIKIIADYQSRRVPFDNSPFITPHNAARLFKEWLNKQGLEEPITVAGKNYATFDRPFLNKLPHWKDEINIRHRVIDPAILYYRKGDQHLPGTETCMQRAGISNPHEHTAVYDALTVIKLIRGKLCK